MTTIGIVGGGIRGRLFHQALQGFEDITVSGIVDSSPAVRETVRTELPVPVFDDLDAILDGTDGVIVATPDFAHFDLTSRLLEAGIPVLVEKPLTTCVSEARTLAALAADRGVEVFVGFENRWANVYRQAAASIEQGAIGAVRSIYGRLSDRREVPMSMLSWAASSSPAWFLMPHTLDIALWLTGSRVESVVAEGTRGVLAGLGVDCLDSVSAIFRLESGAMVVLESSWALPDAYPSLVDFKIEVLGGDGSILMDNTSQMLQTITSRVDQPRTLGSSNAGRMHGPAAWMVQSFARKVSGMDESLPTIDDGVHVTEAIAAVHQSLESGDRVHLSEVGPLT